MFLAWENHLNRDISFQSRIEGFIHNRHSSFTQLFKDMVAPQRLADQRFCHIARSENICTIMLLPDPHIIYYASESASTRMPELNTRLEACRFIGYLIRGQCFLI